jgi:hypothetical protein
MILKTCTRCLLSLPESNFHISGRRQNKRKTPTTRRRSYCKHCAAKYRDTDSARAAQKKYRESAHGIAYVRAKYREYRDSGARVAAYRRCICHRMLQGAKTRARRLGLPFSLVPADIQLPEACPVLGIPILIGSGHTVDGSPTVDRIVPEFGYVSWNVRIISHRANRLKNDGTAEELRLVAEYVARAAVEARAALERARKGECQ